MSGPLTSRNRLQLELLPMTCRVRFFLSHVLVTGKWGICMFTCPPVSQTHSTKFFDLCSSGMDSVPHAAASNLIPAHLQKSPPWGSRYDVSHKWPLITTREFSRNGAILVTWNWGSNKELITSKLHGSLNQILFQDTFPLSHDASALYKTLTNQWVSLGTHSYFFSRKNPVCFQGSWEV